MPYVVTCKFVIPQLQLVDKDELLRIAVSIEVKKPEESNTCCIPQVGNCGNFLVGFHPVQYALHHG